jgi:hypothetical protein
MRTGHYLGYEPSQGDAIIDTFVCDGITDIYTLRQEPANLDTLEVSVGGLMQSDVAYTILTSNGGRDIQVPGVAVDTKIIVRQHGERYAVGTVSSNSILTNQIKDDQITTPKILDANVTDDKIDTMTASKLTGPYPPLDGYSIDRGQYGKWQPTLTTHGTVESGKSYFVDTSGITYLTGYQDSSGTTEQAIDESFQAHTVHWWDAGSLTNDDPPATMIDTVNYKVGAKSMYFDNALSQNIQFAEYGFDHIDWTFGTDPFTIEMWIRPNRFDNKGIIGFAGHSMELRLDMDAADTDVGHLVWQSNVGTYHQSTATAGTNQLVRGQEGQTHGIIKKDEWAHVAVTRNENNGMTMWVNGINAYTSWNMGKHPTQDDAYGHYQMNTFSAADVLRPAGTYTNVTGTSDGTSTGNPSGGNNDGILPTVGTFDIKVNSSGAITNVYVITPGRGHRVDDTITILDSALGGGGAANFTMDVQYFTPIAGSGNIAVDNTAYTTGGGGFVIGNDSSNNYFKGNIDHVRISKVARYGGTRSDGNDSTVNFTPPTEPWKPDADTLLILNVDDARLPVVVGIDHSTGGTNGKIGAPVLDSDITKFGLSSMAFGGAVATGVTTTGAGGDFIKQAMSDKWNFGTGDFTVESWIYKTENQDQPIVGTTTATIAPGNGSCWRMKTGTINTTHANLKFGHGGTDDITSHTDHNFTLHEWHHVAAVRESGTLSLYIDGVAAQTPVANTTDYNQRNELWVGAVYDLLTTSMYTGYIDEVRISNVARYSGATFSLPTEAHVADSNTLTLIRMESNQLNITLPPSPSASDTINIWDVGGQCGTNPVHLLRNGNKINSLEDIIALDSNSFFSTLVYSGATRGWLIVPR